MGPRRKSFLHDIDSTGWISFCKSSNKKSKHSRTFLPNSTSSTSFATTKTKHTDCYSEQVILETEIQNRWKQKQVSKRDSSHFAPGFSIDSLRMLDIFLTAPCILVLDADCVSTLATSSIFFWENCQGGITMDVFCIMMGSCAYYTAHCTHSCTLAQHTLVCFNPRTVVLRSTRWSSRFSILYTNSPSCGNTHDDSTTMQLNNRR